MGRGPSPWETIGAPGFDDLYSTFSFNIDCKEATMYPTIDLQTIGAVRHPIQCEGIERGPKRIAEVAVSGSVNPQQWGQLLGPLVTDLVPNLMNLL